MNDPDDITWEDPPPKASGRSASKWISLLKELQAHPGKWALLLSRQIHGLNTTPARAAAKALGGRWEFTQRKDGENGIRLFVRYLGPEEAE